MQEDAHLNHILAFIKNYSISYIDEQTLVVEPTSTHDIANSIYTNDTNQPEHSPYLIKYMNVPKNTCHLT